MAETEHFEDIERKLRDYFSEASRDMPPVEEAWRRIAPRLGPQRQAPSWRRFWAMLSAQQKRSLVTSAAVALLALAGAIAFLVVSLAGSPPLDSMMVAGRDGESPERATVGFSSTAADGPASRPVAGDGFASGSSQFDMATPGGERPALAEIAGQQVDRLVVRTGEMTLESDRVTATVADIGDLARRLSGYVVSSRVEDRGRDRQPAAAISIRVPSERFDEAIVGLRETGTRVTFETTSSKDVTEEHVDLQAQLVNLGETEAQLRELMSRAGQVSEVLNVQRELTRVRGEIERTEGRIAFLERTAAESLIAVRVDPAEEEAPLVSQEWSASRTLRASVRGLTEALQGIADSVINALVYAPLWFPPVLAVGGGLWWLRRRFA